MNRTLKTELKTNRVFERAATMEEAYASVEHLIRSSVAGFVRKHGIDYEEALSRANLGFMEAFAKYDPDKGSFGASVCYLAWVHMMDEVRESSTRGKRFPHTNDLSSLQSKRQFDLSHILSELSKDASTAAQVLLSLPESKRMDSLRKKLFLALGELGWPAARVLESLQELGEAFSA